MAILDLKTNEVKLPHYALQLAAYSELEYRGETEGLDFDEERHLFTINGEPLPSVTHILHAEGFCPSFQFIDPVYLTRGSHVHKATELWDMDDLDEENLDEELMPYLESYKKAKAEIGFEITGIEVRKYHPVYRYAGIIDRVIVGSKNYVLYLTPGVNAGYKLEQVNNTRANLNTFLSALNCRRWKEQNLKGE